MRYYTAAAVAHSSAAINIVTCFWCAAAIGSADVSAETAGVIAGLTGALVAEVAVPVAGAIASIADAGSAMETLGTGNITAGHAVFFIKLKSIYAVVTIRFSPSEIAIARDSAFTCGCAIPVVVARAGVAEYVFCATTVYPVIPCVAAIAVGGEVVGIACAYHLAGFIFAVPMIGTGSG